ncbi:hypothetical protein Q4566_08460 [Tamlana sp. 2_MG-2023]|uniref:hypothetical protein n=1 Tax=unclassified Tamlana TaxID=2614803 RepID=UPI0026E11665|nr:MULTISPECIES: hypothetical protein [unclassified Tamlana]MDO6760225.1 hypothetical protein [Tamlana sp. 2_MG-2023]MDO6790077.1 hypothetical protein [Tamlana sp. 1_MG-2023]
MRASRIKNNITYFFLILFLTVKMVGLHEVFHHSDDEDHALHCVVCNHATAFNLTPALTPDIQEFSFLVQEFVYKQELRKYYNYRYSNAIDTDELVSRPPPFLG